ncbi:hypothetical protein Sme01_64170 [Sphaerisporangium melleum]|uniref:Uncharacterized protein n=1 Tax=Sphaerisporangium melleum TaxID=321316 RepID=A0A917RFD9_9ACTN|nr:hypothetical protein GCM10007964_54040 [Sphaerisporangium melleum]GII73941.1 hypothetical protein Sme01_64170 [Sphaerisporangium melleum]
MRVPAARPPLMFSRPGTGRRISFEGGCEVRGVRAQGVEFGRFAGAALGRAQQMARRALDGVRRPANDRVPGQDQQYRAVIANYQKVEK